MSANVPSANSEPPKVVFTSGAQSSGHAPDYHLMCYMPSMFVPRVGRRFEAGAIKYGLGNYEKGFEDHAFILDRINHAIEHLLNVADCFMQSDYTLSGLKDGDELAGVGWAVAFLMAVQEHWREKEVPGNEKAKIPPTPEPGLMHQLPAEGRPLRQVPDMPNSVQSMDPDIPF